MSDFPRITSLKIDGFKVFDKFEAKLGPLEVIVGANGSGKSSLFALLKFILDGQSAPIPPEIIAGPVGENVFFQNLRDSFSWEIESQIATKATVRYGAEIIGPRGKPRVSREDGVYVGEYNDGTGVIALNSEFDLSNLETVKHLDKVPLGIARHLKLSLYNCNYFGFTRSLSIFIKEWEFHNSFHISSDKIRKSCVVEQEPSIHDDFGNLSSILHYYVTEHPQIIVEIDTLLSLVYAGVKVRVKARGGPGEVIGFLREEESGVEFTLADLSDGILRFLCWAVLCLHPKPPTLVCVDEPELGLHPRVLPLLAGLFKKLSERTQVILATHSSYFLSQFDLDQIAVMRKVDGRAEWIKPADHKVFRDILADFGQDEIERLHISDELEVLA
ncbi:MAG: AAA family ATPase [Pseudomonadota bacterium]